MVGFNINTNTNNHNINNTNHKQKTKIREKISKIRKKKRITNRDNLKLGL